MRNLYGVRVENRSRYFKCISLRKEGLSYGEIQKIIPVAQSTLNNWLQLAGLTLTPEHLNIQLKKSKENHILGTIASRETRRKRRELEINKTIQKLKGSFGDSLFIIGTMLYEAEGSKSKSGAARFTNSDYKLIQVYKKFVEKYFQLTEENIKFRLAIHESRSKDLERIKGFWCKKLHIASEKIKISWKKNKIVRRRKNLDYVGQMELCIVKVSFMTRKLLASSDIILMQQLRSG